MLTVRAGICATVLLAFGSLAACSSSSHAKSTTSTTTGTPGTGGSAVDVAGFPNALHLDPVRVLRTFVDQQYGDGTPAHWYQGLGQSGQPVSLAIDALASTADQARGYCAAIAGPAAFFMKGVPYTLVVSGEVSVPAGGSGAVSFQPAKFKPVSCPKPTGPLVDPVRANAPRSSNGAIDRFFNFLYKYYSASDAPPADSWYAGSAYVGTGTKIAVDVRDATAALGIKRCATVEPLAAWLLGPFAKQFTVQVSGMTATARPSWPAVNCP
jgi:hypothetical protein